MCDLLTDLLTEILNLFSQHNFHICLQQTLQRQTADITLEMRCSARLLGISLRGFCGDSKVLKA